MSEVVLSEKEYKTLTVIVPVFDELPLMVDVIVVDDGSTDGTEKVLKLLGDSTVQV